MTQLKHKNLTQQIIGSYYNVFNGLSRTYPEAIYEKAMLLEMQERQITCRQQDEYRIYYKDILVGVQRLDLYRIYANAVCHELKMRGIAAAPQKTFAVFYRGQPVGHIKFDHLQIEGQLLLFPIAIQDMNQIHLDNIRAYLCEERIPLGLVANFHPESLDFLVLRT